MSQPRRTRWLLTIAMLVAATAILHGWSLADGTVLDDHWHQTQLRDRGWGWTDLMQSLVIAPADFSHHWWQTEEVSWGYGRPLFILAMKFVYVTLGGEDPFALHVYSLLLHLAGVMLVMRLAWLLSRNWSWSTFAGLVFAIYPHSVMTVEWSSAQNVVQQTTLLLAALLAYIAASRLSIAPRAESETPQSAASAPSWPLFALVLLLWLAALFTRENALILAPIAVFLDWSFGGGWRFVRSRLAFYAVFATLGIAFIGWRATTIGAGMPDVYFQRPAGDPLAYAAWCAAKLVHYVCVSVWPAPMMVGPTGRLHPWADAPGDMLLMLGIVVVIFGAYAAIARREPGWWIWPVWIMLSILPVIPVIATPHSGYMSGVGYALAWAVVGRAAAGSIRVRTRRLVHIVAATTLVTFAIFSMFSRWQWGSIVAAERHLLARIADDPPAAETRHVFFINLPFVNVYAKPMLTHALGAPFDRAEVHVLTYSPHPFMVEAPTHVTQLDNHTIRVEIDGQPYFTRLLGRFLMDGFRTDGSQFIAGDQIETPEFTVSIAAVDADAGNANALGVRAFEFRFREPLTSPHYCFYLTTQNCIATKLAFAADLPPGETREATRLADADDSRFAHFWTDREEVPNAQMWMSMIIRSDLYLTGPPFDGPPPAHRPPRSTTQPAEITPANRQ